MSLIENSMLFVRVAQSGSFTTAATLLESSKSQISRRIAHLEQALNVSLFLRTPRGLQLTAVGKQYYDACQAIQISFENANASLKATQEAISGTIAITAPMSLGSIHIGPLLSKFMQIHPDISIELDFSDTAYSLSESHFDLAIRAATHLPDSNLRAKKLFSYDYVIAASPEYFSKYGKPKLPCELQKHKAITCITTSSRKLQTSWPFMYKGEQQDIPLQRIAKVTHMWVQKQFALAGLGLIRVPRYWVSEELDEGTLHSALEDYMSHQSHIFALYKNLNHTPGHLTALIDYLANHLPSELNGVPIT